MSGRQIRASENLSNAALLARVQNLETLLGVGEVQEPGAATLTPSSMTDWSMAPGTNITFYDTAGIARVVLGELPSGDYGLQITDPNSVANEIWPVSSATYLPQLATTATSAAPITDSPEVTCWIGNSGDCLVTVSSTISQGITAELAYVTLILDGSTQPFNYVLVNGFVGTSSGVSLSSVSTSFRYSEATGGTLAPNQDHIFSLKYYVTAGTGYFWNTTIQVQPL